MRQNGVEPFARGNPQLRLNEIHSRDGFGDGVLHLDAGVHLDEVELAVFVHQELNGTGVLIADLGETTAKGFADLLAHLRRYLQRRRFFNQLLMAALNGALALK